MAGIWCAIAAVYNSDQAAQDMATGLLQDLMAGTLLARTQTALLQVPDQVSALFYASLESQGNPDSPVDVGKDPSWMHSMDFCFMNVRGCACGGRPGNFVQAAKILPGITAGAIHLAPFHPVHFDIVYAPDSPMGVDTALADPLLLEAGIGPEDQLRAFMAACRLLGKVVGYDLLPYAAQFSRVALERPGLFRWIRLSEDRSRLVCADPDRPYGQADREIAAELVAGICAAAKDDYGVSSLKRSEGDDAMTMAAKDKAFYTAIRMCMENGVWPVLSHAWNGVGVPAFSHYDRQGDFPLFAYRDGDGLDIFSEAYGIASPYAFHDGLLPNRAPGPDDLPVPNQAAIDYFSAIPLGWMEHYGFRFVRFDAVDRLLWSSIDDCGTIPLSDGLTPDIVRHAIAAIRARFPEAGMLAARYGNEFDEFAELGIDVLMGSDMMRRIDAPLIQDAFTLYNQLCERQAHPALHPATVCFTLDAHESASPRLWGAPLAQVLGSERLRLRHVAARFLSVGKRRRPMYEVMGFQDMSSGLYQSTLSISGLSWADDRVFAQGYASIEELYRQLRLFMETAVIAERQVTPEYAWWMIRPDNPSTHVSAPHRLLVVVLSLETADGRPPGTVRIPFDLSWGELAGSHYHLPDSRGYELSVHGLISLDLEYLGCHLLDLSPSELFY
jgi:hypothetical protein